MANIVCFNVKPVFMSTKNKKQTNKQTNKSFKFHACQDHHLTAATEICQSGYLN